MHTHTHTHTQPFYSHFSRTTQVSRCQKRNFWTLWCKGRLTEADILAIWLDATLSGLTSAHLHYPPFFTGRMPFLPPNQQCQSTEGSTAKLTEVAITTRNHKHHKHGIHGGRIFLKFVNYILGGIPY